MTCKGCEKRHVGCHSTCKEYISECNKRKEIREKISKQKKMEQDIKSVEIERSKRYGRNR